MYKVFCLIRNSITEHRNKLVKLMKNMEMNALTSSPKTGLSPKNEISA